MFAHVPKTGQSHAKTKRPIKVPCLKQPIQSRSEIIMLDIATSQPSGAFWFAQLGIAFFGQYQSVSRMSTLGGLLLSAFAQPFERILADGLQHPKACLVFTMLHGLDEAFVQQRRHEFERVRPEIAPRVAYRLGRFECAAAPKDTEPSKQFLLGFIQQSIAPVDGVA